MRFGQLPPGSRFHYQDEAYTKVTPLLAAREADGQQRMIPRSALVEVETSGAVAKTPADSVAAALAAFRQELAPIRAKLEEEDKALLEAALAALHERLAE